MNRFHRWYCRTENWSSILQGRLMPWALESVDLGGDILEVGPGPGRSTDVLQHRYARVTAIECDRGLAKALRLRLPSANVSVVTGDGAAMPFSDRSFSGAVSFTMLHHVPSAELQDRLLAEVFRVLKPGGIFAGTDSRYSMLFRLIHLGDTMVPVAPKTFGDRLKSAGFGEISIAAVDRAFRFRARRPA